jgi:hypothetical protein
MDTTQTAIELSEWAEEIAPLTEDACVDCLLPDLADDLSKGYLKRDLAMMLAMCIYNAGCEVRAEKQQRENERN